MSGPQPSARYRTKPAPRDSYLYQQAAELERLTKGLSSAHADVRAARQICDRINRKAKAAASLAPLERRHLMATARNLIGKLQRLNGEADEPADLIDTTRFAEAYFAQLDIRRRCAAEGIDLGSVSTETLTWGVYLLREDAERSARQKAARRDARKATAAGRTKSDPLTRSTAAQGGDN